MTQLEVATVTSNSPAKPRCAPSTTMREVYGIRKIAFNEKERIIRIEFDASRLKEPNVAGLLRRAGMD